MDGEAATLVATLRAGIDPHSTDLDVQQRYERMLKQDAWKLGSEALPLLVGVDPRTWQQHVAKAGASAEAAALHEQLAGEADADGCITPGALRDWARRAGIELPASLGSLLDYIARVVPPPREAESIQPTPASGDREIVLGAALALVTKFPDRCRDAHGFFDGARIADLMLEKAVLWFPDRPPALSRDEIARLIERSLE